ncbi:DNA sulfur modification protein DndB [Mangrovimonas sp. TPBH4]|uniref:DNA sulfur modification protein DndB n=1 Tax=Mangrovimonas sp. TPBH4 TaxID=1645914 RepID=UPI0006B409D6|nr:DNA sulfur modification protein DndB [Mangrovimonas sp. TPBH4]
MNISQTNQTFSSNYTFLHSNFDWLNLDNTFDFTIQSLVVSAPFFSLKDDLKILDDLGDYKDLGFELLVQRDIDKQRVKTEIVENYLEVEGKTNFFPPIVVALIPGYKSLKENGKCFKTVVDDQNPNSLMLDIGGSSIIQTFQNEGYENDLKKFFLSKQIKYGELKWDKEKTNAIIIDGQHRFYALKKFMHSSHIELSKCFFPVNFVVITPEPNKEVSAAQYIKLSRELFIDINKNAKQVSHTRQILLDDIDFKMYLTRNSIKQYNITEDEDFIQWEEEKGIEFLSKIPQPLVNWNSELNSRDQENIKLFNLAQITSTSLLHKIIKDFIFTPNKKENTNIFKTLFRILELDELLPEEGSPDELHLNTLQTKKSLFEDKIKDIEEEILEAEKESLGDQESDYQLIIEQAKKRITVLNENALKFEPKMNDWLSKKFFSESSSGKYFSKFYSQFKPYRETIKLIQPFFNEPEKSNKEIINALIDPKQGNKKTNYQFKSESTTERFNILFDELNRLKKESVDVRYTVFQRAIFSELPKTLDLISILFPDDTIDTAISKYIVALSSVYSKGLLNKDLKIQIEDDLFEDAFEGYSVKEIHVWRNILISDNLSGLKYRDSDTIKIADLIRIFVMAEAKKKELNDLKSEYGTRVSTLITQIRNAYKSSYEKEIKEKLGLNNLNEVRELEGYDNYKFALQLEQIIALTINKKILE